MLLGADFVGSECCLTGLSAVSGRGLLALVVLLGRSEEVLRGETVRASAWRFVELVRDGLFGCVVFVRFALTARKESVRLSRDAVSRAVSACPRWCVHYSNSRNCCRVHSCPYLKQRRHWRVPHRDRGKAAGFGVAAMLGCP